MLEAEMRVENGISVIELTGSLDLDGARLLKEKISGARQSGSMKVVVDFTNVEKVQSAHLQHLVAPIRALTAIRGKVAFCGMSKAVHQMIQSTMFYSIIDTFDNADDAVGTLC